MMRLIDAEALDRSLADAQAKCKKSGGNFRFGVLSNVRANIADAPTIDAIPVDWLQACIKIAELFGDERNEKLLTTLINLWHRDGYGFFEKRTKEAE